MTSEPKGCPSEEVLASYIDDALSVEERQRVTDHAAGCSTCSTMLAAWDAEAAPVTPSEQFKEMFDRMRPTPSVKKPSARSSARRHRRRARSVQIWGGTTAILAAAAAILIALMLRSPSGRGTDPTANDHRAASDRPSVRTLESPDGTLVEHPPGWLDDKETVARDTEGPQDEDDASQPPDSDAVAHENTGDDMPWLRADRGAEKPDPVPASAADDSRHVAYLDATEGSVESRGGQEIPWHAATPGVGLSAGSGLRTKLSRARIAFESGTVLYMNRFTTLSFAPSDGAPRIELLGGEVYVETAKQDTGFGVETEHGRAVDLGTKFGVKSANSHTTVVVVEGSVRASTDAGKADLTSNQEVFLLRKTSPPGMVRTTNDLGRRLAWARQPEPEPEVVVPQTLAILSFTLIDCDTNAPVPGFDAVKDGTTLDLATLPTRNLNLRANATDDTESVRFQFVGTALDPTVVREIENNPPFGVAGGLPDEYDSMEPRPGTFVLVATPYSKDTAKGTAGQPLTIRLRFIDSAKKKR